MPHSLSLDRLEHLLPSVCGGFGVLIPGSVVRLDLRVGPVLHLVVIVRMAEGLSVVLDLERNRRVPRVTVAVTMAVTVSGEVEELGLWLRAAS